MLTEKIKKLTFKNNALFSSCISKINNTFIENAKNFDMSMHNLLLYSDIYSLTSVSLWNYYRDEVNDDANENNYAGNYRINYNKTTTSKSFEYKTKIIGSTRADNSRLNAEVAALLKYLINFWRSLDLLLINCEIELDLTWWKKCVIYEISRWIKLCNI